MRNYVAQEGRLTRDPKFHAFDGRWLLSFTLAVESIQYNPETKERGIVTWFFSVEYWMPAEPTTPDMMLYQGDEVALEGELAQRKKPDEQGTHTRIVTKQVTLLQRSRIGAEAAAQVEPF
jgi:single-stranded DNA-binding protein